MSPEPLNLPDSDDHATWGEWVRARSSEELDRARALVDRLRTDPPTEALEVLRVWDRAVGHLGGVAAAGSLFGNVHPDQTVRDVADAAEQEADKLSTEWSLDRTLYEVFAGLSADGLDPTAAADCWRRCARTSVAPGWTATRRPATGSRPSATG